MLSEPSYGWTTFLLSEDKEYELGYLTDVAIEWLAQAIHGLETMDVFSVHGFCEPGRMICTVSYWSCYVMVEDEDRNPPLPDSIIQHHISMIDFCKTLYADISENLDAWAYWNEGEIRYSLKDEDDDEKFNEAINKRKANIENLLKRLKQLIERREEHFGPRRCFF